MSGAVDQGRRLDGDPEEAEVVGPGDEAHQAQEGEEAGAEDAVGAFLPVLEVADRVEGAEKEEARDDEEYDLPRRIEDEPVAERYWRSSRVRTNTVPRSARRRPSARGAASVCWTEWRARERPLSSGRDMNA